MDAEVAKKYTPEERLANTLALVKDLDRLAAIRSELFFAMSAGARFNTFLKTKGLEPAAWEGVVAACIEFGKLSKRP